jgi:hypothetical protein
MGRGTNQNHPSPGLGRDDKADVHARARCRLDVPLQDNKPVSRGRNADRPSAIRVRTVSGTRLCPIKLICQRFRRNASTRTVCSLDYRASPDSAVEPPCFGNVNPLLALPALPLDARLPHPARTVFIPCHADPVLLRCGERAIQPVKKRRPLRRQEHHPRQNRRRYGCRHKSSSRSPHNSPHARPPLPVTLLAAEAPHAGSPGPGSRPGWTYPALRSTWALTGRPSPRVQHYRAQSGVPHSAPWITPSTYGYPRWAYSSTSSPGSAPSPSSKVTPAGASVKRCGISHQAATSWVASTPSTYRTPA